MLFPKTQEAFGAIDATELQGYGSHHGHSMAVGAPGTLIAEMDFDPTLHRSEDIHHLSMLGVATDTFRVQVKQPEQPLGVNIVVHQDDSRDDPRIVRSKLALAERLYDAVDDALPGWTDFSELYYMGPRRASSTQFEALALSDDPEENAKAVAGVCTDGLSIIISDFNRLPLDRHAQDLGPAVAVKTNHPAEVFFPANVGTINLGGYRQVNTNKKRDLAEANEDLAQRNAAVERRIKAAGMTLARVVFSPKERVHGFDVKQADIELADAIEKLSIH